MPFHVDVRASLDQICILFQPAALSVFTGEPYDDLLGADNVFDVFRHTNDFFLEQIFEEENLFSRAAMLEKLLLTNLKDRQPEKLKEALNLIAGAGAQNPSIETLAKKLGMSSPTLFRLFKNNVGMNPKSYIKTHRFRNILNEVLQRQQALTRLAHDNFYYDQAHFIKDFKSFSGYSPNQLLQKISIEQNDLAWIYNDKTNR